MTQVAGLFGEQDGIRRRVADGDSVCFSRRVRVDRCAQRVHEAQRDDGAFGDARVCALGSCGGREGNVPRGGAVRGPRPASGSSHENSWQARSPLALASCAAGAAAHPTTPHGYRAANEGLLAQRHRAQGAPPRCAIFAQCALQRGLTVGVRKAWHIL